MTESAPTMPQARERHAALAGPAMRCAPRRSPRLGVERARCALPAPQHAALAGGSSRGRRSGCRRRSRAARARRGAPPPSRRRARRRPSGPARSRCAAGTSARGRSSSCRPCRRRRRGARARRRRAAGPSRRSAGWGRSAARARGRPRRGRRGRAAARRAATGPAGSRWRRSPRRRRSRARRRAARAGRRRVATARVWKPAASAIEPSSTRPRTASPSAPRAGSWSSPPPPYLRPGRAAADRPHDLRRRLGVAQRDQVEDRVERRVAAADDHHAPARVARAVGAEHVRDAVDDAVGARALAGRRQAAGAERVRSRPRPGGVDDGAREDAALARRRCSTTSSNGASSRPSSLSLSMPGAGDAGHARGRGAAPRRSRASRPAARGSARRSRRRSGSRRGSGARPAVALEQRAGDRVEVVLPRREDAHVPPLDGCWRRRASPASKTIGSRPRASRCAAAARPTGPAPITATG